VTPVLERLISIKRNSEIKKSHDKKIISFILVVLLIPHNCNFGGKIWPFNMILHVNFQG